MTAIAQYAKPVNSSFYILFLSSSSQLAFSYAQHLRQPPEENPRASKDGEDSNMKLLLRDIYTSGYLISFYNSYP